MSKEYEGQDPLQLAAQAEQDLNSQQAQGENQGASDSTLDSGVDESVTNKFPGSTVTTGPQSSGRELGIEEGGVDPSTGQAYKADAFEGVGGPEDKARLAEENRGGDDDVQGT